MQSLRARRARTPNLRNGAGADGRRTPVSRWARLGASLAFSTSMKRALQVILGISLFGVAFSGALSYQEVFGRLAVSCPAPGAPGTVFGYPACVYGFFMFVLLAGTAFGGLLSGRRTRSATPRLNVASI
jgi:hypothetical protein